MNIWEAFTAIDCGLAVKREKEEVVYCRLYLKNADNHNIFSFPRSEYDAKRFCLCLGISPTKFTREDIEATDWELYERPPIP